MSSSKVEDLSVESLVESPIDDSKAVILIAALTKLCKYLITNVALCAN
jgi:hypothetical protein